MLGILMLMWSSGPSLGFDGVSLGSVDLQVLVEGSDGDFELRASKLELRASD